jgi:hypothetical protein
LSVLTSRSSILQYTHTRQSFQKRNGRLDILLIYFSFKILTSENEQPNKI